MTGRFQNGRAQGIVGANPMNQPQLPPAKIICCAMIMLLPAFALRAQTIIQNFSGVNLNDDLSLGFNLTPPDTMGAAGTNQFVVFVNRAFAVYNKAGVRQLLISD